MKVSSNVEKDIRARLRSNGVGRRLESVPLSQMGIKLLRWRFFDYWTFFEDKKIVLKRLILIE